MEYRALILESVIWSIIWIFFVIISVRVFPFTIEHDYPNDVRKLANIQKPTSKQKLQGIIFGIIGFVILFGLLIVWIICMTWNIVDLVIVDCLMICKFSVKWFVLPKTENYIGNKNYRFHFIGFLKGCFAMTVIAILFSAISYGIILA